VMNRVKQQLDPNGILSPGRFSFEYWPIFTHTGFR